MPILSQNEISSLQINCASFNAISKILSLFKPDSLFIILSTAHFKFIAVGLEFINSLADVFKKD